MTDSMVARMIRLRREVGESVLRDAGAVYDAITTAASHDVLELSDGWPGLHFLLTGGDVPMPVHVARARGLDVADTSLEQVLMGGEPTPYDDGLAVARFLSPKMVALLSARLSKITKDQLARRYDEGIHDVLPTRWQAIPDAAVRLADEFARVVAFYASAAAAGDGILLYIA